MKPPRESLFLSSLRAFFTALFAILGICAGIFLVVLAFYGLLSLVEEKGLPSCVKILPDAEGRRKELTGLHPVILQINVVGEIGKDPLKASKVEEILLKSHEDELKDGRVKGVLLVINSPGGAAVDSDQIYHLLKSYKTQYNIPIYAYIDGLCASGGYYIACASDRIFASDVSLVGSVGVVSWPPFFNVVEAIEKIGVKALTLKAGKDKDTLNPVRPWKEDEQAPYQRFIDYYYAQFVDLVTKERPAIDRKSLVEEYGAQIFPAPIAMEHGYVDVHGASRADVLHALIKKAGIEGSYQVITFKTASWFNELLKERSPLLTGRLKHELALPSAWDAEESSLLQYQLR